MSSKSKEKEHVMGGSRIFFRGLEEGVRGIFMFSRGWGGGYLMNAPPSRSAHACSSSSHLMAYKLLSKNINGFCFEN